MAQDPSNQQGTGVIPYSYPLPYSAGNQPFLWQGSWASSGTWNTSQTSQSSNPSPQQNTISPGSQLSTAATTSTNLQAQYSPQSIQQWYQQQNTVNPMYSWYPYYSYYPMQSAAYSQAAPVFPYYGYSGAYPSSLLPSKTTTGSTSSSISTSSNASNPSTDVSVGVSKAAPIPTVKVPAVWPYNVTTNTSLQQNSKQQKECPATSAPSPPPPPPSTPPPSQVPPPPPTSSTSSQQPSPLSSSTLSSQLNTQKKKEWPPSLRNYVERAFAQCTTEKDQNQMEEKLRQKIKEAIQKGDLMNRDWDNEPIPKLKSKRKKRNKLNDEQTQKIEQRRKRFQVDAENNNDTPSKSPQANLDSGSPFEEIDWEALTIKGTCTNLEKPYFRLTKIPDPSTIRPEHILKQSFEMLKNKWREKQDWAYTCEQFKSIRQDLTVQRIRNEFAVEVYETHARLCLENGDIHEFNQCQSQLRQLYDIGIQGNVLEFTAYRILYLLWEQNEIEIMETLKELPKAVREHAWIKHAFKVQEAVQLKNYHAFFKLYQTAPNMGQYVMDFISERIRWYAVKAMAKAYRPTLPVSFIQEELGFDSTAECESFLRERGAVFERKERKTGSKLKIDTKRDRKSVV